jgi:DNA-binding NarL/FixJ family response regulator
MTEVGFEGWLEGVSVVVVDDGRTCEMLRVWLIEAGATLTSTPLLAQAQELLRVHGSEVDLVVVDADVHPDWELLREHAPCGCGMLVVNDRGDPVLLARVLAHRAGYLSRSVSRSDFVFWVYGIVSLPSPDLSRLAAQGSRLWGLSPQLTRLLHYNLWGYSDRDIADAMSITIKTAQQYQEELRRRTGVKTKQAYLRRLLTLSGRDPLLPMTDHTAARVRYDQVRVRGRARYD